MSLSLFLDTTGQTLMLAFYNDAGQQVFKFNEQSSSHRYHSAILPTLIQQALHANHATAQDMTNITVNIGPGSFTGIRTGVSMARTLAQFTQAKTYGVNTFDIWLTALHQHHPKTCTIALLMDAFRNRAYTTSGTHENDTLTYTSKATITPVNELETFLATVKPDYLYLAKSLCPKISLEPSIYALLEETAIFTPDIMRLLTTQHPKKYLTPWQALLPLYLQEPHITQKKPSPSSC